jgi:hypothetical protein
MDSLLILNTVMTIGVICVAIAGGNLVWQSYAIDINKKSHNLHQHSK